MKAYDDLFFTDDFMFCKVMQNEEICIGVVEALLNIKVRKIEYVNQQHYLKEVYTGRGVRLDVYVQDSDKVFDIEMQTYNKKDEGLRMRYYQSLIDIDMLRKGDNYSNLKESYILFICTYDPFGLGLPVYTFESLCREKPDFCLNDKQHKVVYNVKEFTKIKQQNTKALLEFIANKQPTNSFTKKIQDAISSSKGYEPWRAEYMLWEDQIKEWKEEAREEGLKEGKAEGLAEGKAEGLAEGKNEAIKELIKRKLDKNKTVEQIADELETTVDEIKRLIES